MVAVFCPVSMPANCYGLQFAGHICRSKAVIKMVRFVFMPVHIKRWMFFFSLYLFMVKMVGTVNVFFFQKFYNA